MSDTNDVLADAKESAAKVAFLCGMAASYMAVNHPVDLGQIGEAERTADGTPLELVHWRYAMIGGLLLPRIGEPTNSFERTRNYIAINALYSTLAGGSQIELDATRGAMEACMDRFRRDNGVRAN